MTIDEGASPYYRQQVRRWKQAREQLNASSASK
jgi:hypothetical protein